MGTSPGDVFWRINKLGIKSVNPAYWPPSPASPLCEQTWAEGVFLSSFPWDWAEKADGLKRESRASSYSCFCRRRDVLGGGALKGHSRLPPSLSQCECSEEVLMSALLWSAPRGNPRRLQKDCPCLWESRSGFSTPGCFAIPHWFFWAPVSTFHYLRQQIISGVGDTIFKRAQGIPKHTALPKITL